MNSLLKRYFVVLESRKLYFFGLSLSFFVGIVLGIVFFGEQERLLFASNSIDFLILTLSKDSNLLSLFFSRIMNGTAFVIIFALTGLTIWLCPFHFIIVIYRGYILGAASVIFVSGFGITGAVLFVFAIFLQNIITTAALIAFSTLSFDISKKFTECGNFNYKNYIICAIAAMIICILGALIEFLILLCVLRPLNFYF